MRIAVLIIGLIFSLWMTIEGWTVGMLFDVGGAEEQSAAAALGFVAGFVGIIASALVIAFPMISMVLFVLAGLFSIGAASSGYGNHEVFAAVIFALAIMSFFGWRGKKKDTREKAAEVQRQRERDDRLEALLRQQQLQSAAHKPAPAQPEMAQGTLAYCTSCGTRNVPGSNFCAECGAPMAAKTERSRGDATGGGSTLP